MATRTISAAGGNWSDTAAWVEGAVPINADDVVATAASGSLTVTAGAVCRSLNLTGYTKTFAITTVLTIGFSTGGPGDAILTLPATGYTQSGTSGDFVLSTSAPNPQIVTVLRSITVGIVISGTGSVRLGANLSIVGTGPDVTFTSGTFDLNGFNLTTTTFGCTGSLSRTLILGTGTTTLTSAGSSAWVVSGSNFTVSAASSTIKMGAGSFLGASATYGTLDYSNAPSSSPGISGSNIFSNLLITTSSTVYVRFAGGSKQTVTGTFRCRALGSGVLHVMSGEIASTISAGIKATVDLGTAGTTDFAGTNFMDIALIGTNTPAGGSRVGDALGNSGITFDTRRVLYWVGNSGTWLDTSGAHWALTSGGSALPPGSFPMPQDDVVIDGASFTANDQTISIDSGVQWNCRNLSVDISRTGCKFSAAGNFNLNFFGNVLVQGAGLFSLSGGLSTTMVMRARTPATLTGQPAAGPIMYSLTVQCPGGSVTLGSDIALNSVLSLYAGTLDAAGYAVSGGSFSSLMPGNLAGMTRELRMGGGAWAMGTITNPEWRNATAVNLFTLTRGTSTLLLTGRSANGTSFDLFAAGQPQPPVIVNLATDRSARFLDSGTWDSISLVQGTLEVNTASITLASFSSVGSQVRTLLFTSGTLNVTRALVFAGTNMTFTPGTGTIKCTPSGPEATIDPNGLTLNILSLTPIAGSQITVFGRISATTVSASGPVGGTATISFADDVVASTLTATGNSATNRLKFYGPPGGGQVTITANTAVNLNNSDWVNIVQAGTGAWTGTSKTNTFTGYRNQAVLL